jgi:hypothetical protein
LMPEFNETYDFRQKSTSLSNGSFVFNNSFNN